MSEVFDYRAWQRDQAGVNPDNALLVTFYYEAEEQSDGDFINVEWIKIWKDKNSEICRKVIPEDKVRFKERYERFKANEEVPAEGTPISACPLSMPSNIAACRAESIFTLEQLAETPDNRLMRGGLVEFKYMIKEWLEARGKDHYIKEFRARMEKLEAENAMLKEKFKNAGVPEPVVKKKRGRPRGSKNAKPANGS